MKLLFIASKKRFLDNSLASLPEIGRYENDFQISWKVENFSKSYFRKGQKKILTFIQKMCTLFS